MELDSNEVIRELVNRLGQVELENAMLKVQIKMLKPTEAPTT